MPQRRDHNQIRSVRLAATALFAALVLAAPADARGPASIADVAEGLQDAVVNISTTQTLKGTKDASPG
ncbi:MAG: hypothetical protein ACOYB4_12155, partial [Methyloceanibacter sp.]